ncbi:MAG: hypothetical protein HZC17_04160 [Candidatus Omnitrophica bacterium]|nr:hypothetical protein [Candidatus Omnitrophota bacterium]
MSNKKTRLQQLEERYQDGYKRMPEKVDNVEPLFRAGLESFTPEIEL